MPVKENSIHTPREEMALLQANIEGEKHTRRSLRISQNPNYYSSQREYLEAQIKMFQEKLDILEHRYNSAEEQIEESFDRQRRYERRYATLKHRVKIERMLKLKEEMAELKEEMEG
jgi:chromosome segregation ATPase